MADGQPAPLGATRLGHRPGRLAPATRAHAAVIGSGRWTSTSPRSTCSCATRSGTSWRPRSRRPGRAARTGPSLSDRDRQADRRARLARHPDPRGRGRRRPRHAGLCDRVEEIGRVWGSLGLIVAAHTSLGCGPLHLAGSDGQKERYLVPMASGKVHRRLRPDRAGGRLRCRRHADDGELEERRRMLGPRRGASGSSPTPARPGRTSSPPGPGPPRRATPRSARSSCPPTRPGSQSGGSRTSSASMPRRPASCGSSTPASRRRTCSGARAMASGRSSRSSTVGGSRSAHWRSVWRRRRLMQHPVRPDTRAVRPADRHLPGRGVHGRRHGDRDRGCPIHGLEGCLAQGPGP